MEKCRKCMECQRTWNIEVQGIAKKSTVQRSAGNTKNALIGEAQRMPKNTG